MPSARFMLPAAAVTLLAAGLALTATLPGGASTPTPGTVTVTPTPIDVPYGVGTQSGVYTVQPDPVTVTPATETVTETATVTAPAPAGYTPYMPSASLKPGRDYQVGVEPFVATGLHLTKVGPNMPIPGTSLTSDAQGNIIVTQAGAVLNGLDLPTGYIDVRAANATISQSLVEGYANSTLTANRGLINATSPAATGLVVQDTTLDLRAGYTATPWNGITGHDFTALRVKVRDTTDGFGIFNTNAPYTAHVSIVGCDVDQLTYTSPDPNHSSDKPISHSHNDAIQIQGAASGSSVDISYSTLNGYSSPRGQIGYSPTSPDPVTGGYNIHYPYTEATSALILTPNVAPITGLHIVGNWLDGGGYTVNIPSSNSNNFGEITDNRFGHDTRPDVLPAYQISYPKVSGATVTGNVYDDTGLPVAVHAY